jgi:hypothetical protein
MEEVQLQASDDAHGAARARLGGGHALAKGLACGAQTEGERMEPTSDRRRSEETPLARRWDPLGPIWRQTPGTPTRPRRPGGRPEHAPHSPTSASGAQPNAPQRPAPVATRGTEVGWELHSKEHTSKRNLEMPYAFKVSMIH